MPKIPDSPHPLEYHAPPARTTGWRGGDTVFVAVALCWSLFNIFTLAADAGSRDLLGFFIGACAVGVVLAFPVQLALRNEGVTWRGALAVILCLAALASANLAFWLRLISSV